MKVQQLTIKYFKTFGIIPDKFIRMRPFNKMGFFLLILHGIQTVSYFLFALLEAKDFKQCANAAFMTASAISAYEVYVTCLWKRAIYFQCIEFLNDTVNKSKKTQQFLVFTSQKSGIKVNISNDEKWTFPGLIFPSSKSINKRFHGYEETFSKFMHIGIVKMIPIGSMSPLLVVSYFSYYIMDSGSNSFILPFPMWYDLKKNSEFDKKKQETIPFRIYFRFKHRF